MKVLLYRDELRVRDFRPLKLLSEQMGEQFLVLFLLDRKPMAASAVWLHHALKRLETDLGELGIELQCFKGDCFQFFQELIKDYPVEVIYTNDSADPEKHKENMLLKTQLASCSIELNLTRSNHFFSKNEVLNNSGLPYTVFTPFYKKARELIEMPGDNLEEPELEAGLQVKIGGSMKVDSLGLLPSLGWDKDFVPFFSGSDGKRLSASEQLIGFVKNVVKYKENRDIPSIHGTSRLSPYLAWGEISLNEILSGLMRAGVLSRSEPFVRQLFWREFAWQLLQHFPQTREKPLREQFEKFEYEENEKHLEAWRRGKTGVPIVDAGMRQLWKTGYMHNRVRMIVASYLIKNLLIHWKEGMKWFEHTLVDFDLANNTLGWQWVAGCGADAAPYFRIFNPLTQSQKFDPDGEYIREYVPELAKLSSKEIHDPSALSRSACKYPKALVDLKKSREEALKRYKESRG